MIQRTGTHEQRVCTYLIGYLGSQVAHRDGVLEGARSNLREVAQQSAVGVGQLKQRYARHESEHLFDDVHQRIGEQQQHAINHKVVVHVMIHDGEVVVLNHLQSQINQCTTHCHEYSSLEHLGTACQFAQRIDGYQTRNNLNDDEFVLVSHGDGTYKQHRDVRDERRARVHKHTHEHRNHGEWHYVDAQKVVAHHYSHYHRE